MIQGEKWKVLIGNNLDLLPTLEDNSIDSIVSDPPYELGFMGKKWDSTGIAYNSDLWRECLRVLKPGGHLLSFGGTRTWHRIAVAIEDAGFEVRDSIAWMYGSGFPKSHNVANAIDKKMGEGNRGHAISSGNRFHPTTGEPRPNGEKLDKYESRTLQSKGWEGWGTALKPAFEPIIVARKPLIGTVAENVLTYGTGGLNIDGSRIGTGTGEKKIVSYPDIRGDNYQQGKESYSDRGTVEREVVDKGRWPANVILDEYTAGLLDEQSGKLTSGKLNTSNTKTSIFGNETSERFGIYEKSEGGASRFFYVAKASKRDRNEGLEELEAKSAAEMTGRKEGSAGLVMKHADGSDKANAYAGTTGSARQNFHPTVKPTELMRYLVKLVTPPNGLVLDPFTGSGSTGKAAILEGFSFLGMEMTEDYIPIIEGRLRHAETQVKENEGLF